MTPREVTFVVTGIAQPKGSMKAFMPRGARYPVVTHDNPRMADWQSCVASEAQRVSDGTLFEGPIALLVMFYLPRPRSLPKRVTQHLKKPDVDKLARCTSDALTGVLYRDDAQIVELVARKVYARGTEAPHALVTVTSVGAA